MKKKRRIIWEETSTWSPCKKGGPTNDNKAGRTGNTISTDVPHREVGQA